LLAAIELLARAALPVEHATVLLAVILLSVAGYATLVYRVGLRPRERLLVRMTIIGARGRWALMRRQVSQHAFTRSTP
jgi:hypothetical protein